MASAHDHHQVILTYHFGREAGILQFPFGTFDKAEFNVAADYGLDDLRRVADGNHQGDSGVGLVKTPPVSAAKNGSRSSDSP